MTNSFSLSMCYVTVIGSVLKDYVKSFGDSIITNLKNSTDSRRSLVSAAIEAITIGLFLTKIDANRKRSARCNKSVYTDGNIRLKKLKASSS